MVARIVAATDGTDGAMGALRLARRLAEREGAPVEVVSAVAPVMLEGTVPYVVPDYAELDRAAAEAMTERVRAQLAVVGGGMAEVAPRVVTGNPAREIAAAAEAAGASLIVMGSGRHRLAERWFGTEVALQVIRLSRVPVLAVPQDADALPSVAVVGMDFSPYSRDAAEQAAELVGKGGTLHLVHAVWAAGSNGGTAEWIDTYRAGAEQRLEEIAGELDGRHPVTVRTWLETGAPVAAVLHVAHGEGADLVAAGSHGHGFFTRLVSGSTSTPLVRRAPCAVLVTPPRADSAELPRRAHDEAEAGTAAMA